MEATFRASMNWLHTWAGIALGGLLFAIFWTGSLAVFDREIDLWMMPMTRVVAPTAISLDALQPSLRRAAAAKAPSWTAILPTERQPVARLRWREGAGTVMHHFDFTSGGLLPDPGTWAGTYFLYPFHYMLHIGFRDIGIWLVGLASMAMLALCVSGVIVHRRIFTDFFTLRAARKPRRLLLDLHNVTGVLGLPFHFVITLSGLVIFFSIYFPDVWQTAYENRQAFTADWIGGYDRRKANKAGELASLDAMLLATQSRWNGEMPRTVAVIHPGDAAAYVSFNRSYQPTVAARTDRIYFDAATGARLHERGDTPSVRASQRFIMGLHLIQFRHWTSRWLYFGLGLLGCVLIATGSLFWLESRRRRHAQLGISGVRVVECLTVGSVTGIIAATFAFFVANRLLPLGVSWASYDRAALEIWTFYIVWLSAFAHAWLRPKAAWLEQCAAIAFLAGGAVALNWLTTGDHLVRSLSHRHLWSVAGMDSLLLASAAIATSTARRFWHRTARRTGSRVPATVSNSQAPGA